MTIITSIWKKVRKIFGGGSVADNIVRGVEVSLRYLPEIMQVVEWLAKMTPNKTDDEIIAAAKQLGLEAPVAGSPSEALAKLAVQWAKRKWPDAAERRIRRAIEIAYGAIRP